MPPSRKNGSFLPVFDISLKILAFQRHIAFHYTLFCGIMQILGENNSGIFAVPEEGRFVSNIAAAGRQMDSMKKGETGDCPASVSPERNSVCL